METWIDEAIKELKRAIEVPKSIEGLNSIDTDLINRLFIYYVNGQIKGDVVGDYLLNIQYGTTR